jgi:hypothetical protein
MCSNIAPYPWTFMQLAAVTTIGSKFRKVYVIGRIGMVFIWSTI